MTALAVSGDVAVALGRTLTTEEDARADSLILVASAFVEEWTGYRFAPGEYTVGRKVRRGRVVLPATVATVDEVREVDQCDGSVETLTVTTDYTTRLRTIYGLGSRQFVEVDFTVTAEVPPVVVALVAGMVAATLEAPAANVSSETAGPFQTSYIDSSGRVFLAVSDKATLRPYRQVRPAMDALG
jgi:hypothetical protein